MIALFSSLGWVCFSSWLHALQRRRFGFQFLSSEAVEGRCWQPPGCSLGLTGDISPCFSIADGPSTAWGAPHSTVGIKQLVIVLARTGAAATQRDANPPRGPFWCELAWNEVSPLCCLLRQGLTSCIQLGSLAWSRCLAQDGRRHHARLWCWVGGLILGQPSPLT